MGGNVESRLMLNGEIEEGGCMSKLTREQRSRPEA